MFVHVYLEKGKGVFGLICEYITIISMHSSVFCKALNKYQYNVLNFEKLNDIVNSSYKIIPRNRL